MNHVDQLKVLYKVLGKLSNKVEKPTYIHENLINNTEMSSRTVLAENIYLFCNASHGFNNESDNIWTANGSECSIHW